MFAKNLQKNYFTTNGWLKALISFEYLFTRLRSAVELKEFNVFSTDSQLWDETVVVEII